MLVTRLLFSKSNRLLYTLHERCGQNSFPIVQSLFSVYFYFGINAFNEGNHRRTSMAFYTVHNNVNTSNLHIEKSVKIQDESKILILSIKGN